MFISSLPVSCYTGFSGKEIWLVKNHHIKSHYTEQHVTCDPFCAHFSSLNLKAMGNFVDAATETLNKRVPEALLGNATSILQGVHAKASEELAPFGGVAQGIVGGLYSAGTDAGLDFSSALRPLPFLLLLLPCL